MPARAPIWTLVLACLFGGMGVAVSFAVLSDPSMLFPGATTSDPMLGSWVVRNLATGVVLLGCAATRRADLLTVAFVARLLTELGDLVLAPGAGDPAGAAVPVFMGTLELGALVSLWRARSA